MLIILSPNCIALTGSLSRDLGYSVQRRKNHFYGVRNSRGHVPPDGHWRFILACAQLAHTQLSIADIRLTQAELYDALYEAHHWIAAQNVLRLRYTKRSYNAADTLNLKTTFSL